MELEHKNLREKNNELVQLVQHWKRAAAQYENEKLELMKENNDLRLKLARLRNTMDSGHNGKLHAEFQSTSEGAISHLVETSNCITRMLELSKSLVQYRHEVETELPRWSTLSNTPSREKINRVPPLLVDGRHIQPVVSLSRTLQMNTSRSINNMNSNQQSRSPSQRPIPMHMLQDVFIPLTRIDAEIPVNNVDMDEDDMAEDSNDDSSVRNMDESQNMSDNEYFDQTSALHTVPEEIEPEDEQTPQRSDNPLEGPSWLLDAPNNTKQNPRSATSSTPDPRKRSHLNVSNASPGSSLGNTQCELPLSVTVACEFTPTVRRRKRTPTPPPALPHSPSGLRRHSNNERILKVLVAKMRLEPEEDDVGVRPKRPNLDLLSPKPQTVFRRRAMGSPKQESSSTVRQESSPMKRPSMEGSPLCSLRDSPSKRLMRFDAPSPNGSTDSRVIVLETSNDHPEPGCSGVSKPRTGSRTNSRDTYTIRPKHNDTNTINHDTFIIPNNNNRDIPNNSNHSEQNSNSLDSQIHNNNDYEKSNSEQGKCSPVNDKRSNRSNRNRKESNNDTNTINHDTYIIPSNNNRDIPNNSNHSEQNSNSLERQIHNDHNEMLNSDHGNCSYVRDKRRKRNNHDNHNHTNDDRYSRIVETHRDSDSSGSDVIGEGRTRRPRKAVVYKEKPLNRKLRR